MWYVLKDKGKSVHTKSLHFFSEGKVLCSTLYLSKRDISNFNEIDYTKGPLCSDCLKRLMLIHVFGKNWNSNVHNFKKRYRAAMSLCYDTEYQDHMLLKISEKYS